MQVLPRHGLLKVFELSTLASWRGQVVYGAECWCSLRPGPGGWTNVGGVPATDPSRSRTCGESDLTIRVLDPAALNSALGKFPRLGLGRCSPPQVIAHGMNYFWRRAHLLPPLHGFASLRKCRLHSLPATG